MYSYGEISIIEVRRNTALPRLIIANLLVLGQHLPRSESKRRSLSRIPCTKLECILRRLQLKLSSSKWFAIHLAWHNMNSLGESNLSTPAKDLI